MSVSQQARHYRMRGSLKAGGHPRSRHVGASHMDPDLLRLCLTDPVCRAIIANSRRPATERNTYDLNRWIRRYEDMERKRK